MNMKRTRDEVAFARAQGRLLYEARQAVGLTREQLSASSDVTPQTIYRIEMGDSTARAYDLLRIASVSRIPLGPIFTTQGKIAATCPMRPRLCLEGVAA